MNSVYLTRHPFRSKVAPDTSEGGPSKTRKTRRFVFLEQSLLRLPCKGWARIKQHRAEKVFQRVTFVRLTLFLFEGCSLQC